MAPSSSPRGWPRSCSRCGLATISPNERLAMSAVRRCASLRPAMIWRARSSAAAEQAEALVAGRRAPSPDGRRRRTASRRHGRPPAAPRSATGDGPRSASPRGSGRACRTSRRSSGRDRASCPAARAARLRAGARRRAVSGPRSLSTEANSARAASACAGFISPRLRPEPAARDVVPVERGWPSRRRSATCLRWRVVEQGEEAVGLRRRCAAAASARLRAGAAERQEGRRRQHEPPRRRLVRDGDADARVLVDRADASRRAAWLRDQDEVRGYFSVQP